MHDDLLPGLVAAAPNNRNVSVVRSDRARLLSYLGRQEEALQEHDRCIEFDEHFSDPDSPNPLLTRANRAQTLSRLGRHDEAATELSAAYDDQLRALGPRHPSTLDSKMGMARVAVRAGESTRAIALYREATDVFVEVLGANHPESQKHCTLMSALELNPALIDAIGIDWRSDTVVFQDSRRLDGYLNTQAEDWQLLFGTATRRMAIKRAAQGRLIQFAARRL